MTEFIKSIDSYIGGMPMKFTREQLNSPVRHLITIGLPSGATLEILRGDREIFATYLLENRPRYTGSLDWVSTLAQILRALVQEGSKIPEEDQAYIRGILPKERKRSPRKDPDACPFCGGPGRINAAESRGRYRWYVECSYCLARTADAIYEPAAWELWRRRRRT